MSHQAQVPIVVVLTLLCALVSVPKASAQEASAQEASSQQAEQELEPCLDCHSSAGGDPHCWENQHRAPGLMPPGESGWGEGHGTHSGCLEGSCATAHGLCFVVDGSGEDLLAQLSISASKGDTRDLMEVVRMLGDRVVLNVGRSAIQVQGCGAEDGFVGHFPLSAFQFSSVYAMMRVTLAPPNLFAAQAAQHSGVGFKDR